MLGRANEHAPILQELADCPVVALGVISVASEHVLKCRESRAASARRRLIPATDGAVRDNRTTVSVFDGDELGIGDAVDCEPNRRSGVPGTRRCPRAAEHSCVIRQLRSCRTVGAQGPRVERRRPRRRNHPRYQGAGLRGPEAGHAIGSLRGTGATGNDVRFGRPQTCDPSLSRWAH
jgi:hypothetical protein